MGFNSSTGSPFQTFVNLSVSLASHIKSHYFIEPVVQYMGRFAQ